MTDWSPVAMSADGSKMVAASNGAGFPAAIYVRQAAPVLSLKACVGHDLVSWRDLSSAAGFSLESRSSLDAGSWARVPVDPVLLGDFYFVTNTPGASSVFYRLHKQ